VRKLKEKKDFVELAVLASLTLPGLGFSLGGLKLCEGARGLTPAGVALLALGGALMVAAGYYHYRKDYARESGGLGFPDFAVVTVVSVAAALLAAGALVHLLR
jgi:hypothetical protein